MLFSAPSLKTWEKSALAGAPVPAREARALPRMRLSHASDHWLTRDKYDHRPNAFTNHGNLAIA
ncbi:MAG: hypothetical protein QOG67_249 [Verrucomicrobiota bacterium]